MFEPASLSRGIPATYSPSAGNESTKKEVRTNHSLLPRKHSPAETLSEDPWPRPALILNADSKIDFYKGRGGVKGGGRAKLTLATSAGRSKKPASNGVRSSFKKWPPVTWVLRPESVRPLRLTIWYARPEEEKPTLPILSGSASYQDCTSNRS